MNNTTDEERRLRRRAASARYRAKNREKVLERERNYRAQNKEKLRDAHRKSRAKHKETARAYAKKWRARNKDKIKEAYRKWRQAHPGYDRIKQNAANLRKREILLGRPKPDVCEVCARTSRQIVYDHCHRKGHARGWLCQECNTILGLANDDRKILLTLAAYLERNRKAAAPQMALAV